MGVWKPSGNPGMGVFGRVTLANINSLFGSEANRLLKPAGWQTLKEIDPLGARGHLWAEIIGGTGDDLRNLVPLISGANRNMGDYEQAIVKFLKAEGPGASVCYRVVPVYDSSGSTVLPLGLQLEAVGTNAANQITQTLFNFTLFNG
jgi:hypothetical protein